MLPHFVMLFKVGVSINFRKRFKYIVHFDNRQIFTYVSVILQ